MAPGVHGAEGAFAWVYRDLNGEVESANGPALAIAYGNGAGAVRGGTDAAAYIVGDYVGDVEAGDSAAAVTLGLFNGSVTAGEDAYVISEQSIGGSATAGRDLVLWAIGGVSGNFGAGRDAQLTSYGATSADLTADRDIRYVWSRGDITGTYDAGRNFGGYAYSDGEGYYGRPNGYDVFSHGSIQAEILATNGSVSSDGGHIGGVAAWGPIYGRIEAAESIGVVRSGAHYAAHLN